MRTVASLLLSLLALAVIWTAVIWGVTYVFINDLLDPYGAHLNYFALAFGILCALLWTYVSVPLTLRPCGIRVPLGLQKRRGIFRRFGFVRFVLLYGVLSWGVAGFICSLMSAWFEGVFSQGWRVGASPWLFRSDWRMLLVLTAWLTCGVLLGCLTWNKPESSTALSR